MAARGGGLSRGIRWLPFVVGLSVACPSPLGWGSAATVLAQEDSGDPAPADMAPPAADEAPGANEAPAVDEAPGADEVPAADEAPVAEEAPAAEEATPAPPPRQGGVMFCVTVTVAANGTITTVSEPCPPESP